MVEGLGGLCMALALAGTGIVREGWGKDIHGGGMGDVRFICSTASHFRFVASLML